MISQRVCTFQLNKPKTKKIDNKGTVRIISNFRHNDEGEMTHMIKVLGHKQLLVENLRSFPTEWMHQRISQFKSSPKKLLPGRTIECVTITRYTENQNALSRKTLLQKPLVLRLCQCSTVFCSCHTAHKHQLRFSSV